MSFFAFFGFAAHALAQGFVPLAPIPNLTEGVVANSGNLANFFNNLYKYLIGLAAMLAVIEIIWGGLEISTKDSVSKQSDGKERITQAIFGLILVLSPVLVFSIINPSILNLSLNLPKLDTKSIRPTEMIKTPGSQTFYNSSGAINANPSVGTVAQKGLWCWVAARYVSSTNDGKSCSPTEVECVASRKYSGGTDTSSSPCIQQQ